MTHTLEIIDVHAGIEGKEILKGVSLTVKTVKAVRMYEAGKIARASNT